MSRKYTPIYKECELCGKSFSSKGIGLSRFAERKCCSLDCSNKRRLIKSAEYCEEIKKLSATGLSAKEIAIRLGRGYHAIAKKREKLNIKYVRKIIQKTCEHCKASYEVSPHKKDRSRFCSTRCYHSWRSIYVRGIKSPTWKPKTIIICGQCGIELSVPPCQKNQRFCTTSCRNKWYSENLKGERASNWQGGASVKSSRRLSGSKWKERRSVILDRDGYRCVRCGCQEIRRLNVHHIIPWRISRDDGYRNLVTLCDVCHGTMEREETTKMLIDIHKILEAGEAVPFSLMYRLMIVHNESIKQKRSIHAHKNA